MPFLTGFSITLSDFAFRFAFSSCATFFASASPRFRDSFISIHLPTTPLTILLKKSAANLAAADLEAVRAERAQLTQTIAKKLDNQKKTEELTPMQKKIRDAPAIAKIIAVKEDLGFVVINAGSSRGIEKGTRFNIRRDKFIVAEVEIGEVVDSTNSIGNIDADKKPPGINIREGDEVIGYPVF